MELRKILCPVYFLVDIIRFPTILFLSSLAREDVVKRELNSLLEKKETFWLQRLRISWLRDGGKNTTFFHAKTSRRKMKNLINGLFNGEGIWCDRYHNYYCGYFREIFQSQGTSSSEGILDAVETKVSSDMKTLLLEEFNAKEIHISIKKMHPTKASSPDGMPALFY